MLHFSNPKRRCWNANNVNKILPVCLGWFGRSCSQVGCVLSTTMFTVISPPHRECNDCTDVKYKSQAQWHSLCWCRHWVCFWQCGTRARKEILDKKWMAIGGNHVFMTSGSHLIHTSQSSRIEAEIHGCIHFGYDQRLEEAKGENTRNACKRL